LRLRQRVFEFVGAIRGIDVHENRTNFGRRELNDHPLKAVCRPDSYAISFLNSKMQQGTCDLLDGGAKLRVRKAPVLVAAYEGGRFGIGLRGMV
jgi:hypothetical protein